MPELPEVETTRLGLEPHLQGQRMRAAIVRNRQLRWPVPRKLSELVAGRRIERLKGQGLSDGDISRIHAPIGLDIGAVTPAEIAVAIMAQITKRLREEAEEEPAAVKVAS